MPTQIRCIVHVPVSVPAATYPLCMIACKPAARKRAYESGIACRQKFPIPIAASSHTYADIR